MAIGSGDRRFGRVVALAAVLVLAVSLARPRDLGGMPVPAFWANKLLQEARYDLVLLGDSRVYRGLSPAEMAREMAAESPAPRIFNFGFSSVGLTEDYLAAGAALLDPSATRPMLLIGVTPLSLTARATRDNGYLDRAARPRRDLWLDRWFGVVPHVLAPLPLREWPTLRPGGDAGRVRYLQRFHEDGWVASRKVPERPDEAVAPYREVLAGEEVSDLVEGDFLAQVADWRVRGVAVFAFRPPTTEAMRAVEADVTGFEESAFADRFESAGGRWIEVDPAAYDSYDGSHLREASALALSRDVARAIEAMGRSGATEGAEAP